MADHAEEKKQISDIAAELDAGKGSTRLDVADLDDAQRGALEEMRGLLTNALDASEIEADNWLVKFLRVSGFSAAAAAEKYAKAKAWRREKGVEGILDKPPQGVEVMRMVVPHAYLGPDKQGRPIYLEKTGHIHVDALVSSVPEHTQMMAHVYGLEYLRARMDEYAAARDGGGVVDQFVTVLDLDGLGLYHAKAIGVLQALQVIDNDYYPDLVGPIVIVNAPWIMPTLWGTVKPILSDNIRAKIHVCGANYKEELLEMIGADQLPREYGGTLDLEIAVAPYEEVRQLLLRDASGLELTEHYVGAGSAFERDLDGDTGDVFLWSFEADPGYDVGFSVSLTDTSKGDGAAPALVKPESRCNSSKGEYVATGPCRLHFKWDNSFSYFNGKNLKYHASVVRAKQRDDEAAAAAAE